MSVSATYVSLLFSSTWRIAEADSSIVYRATRIADADAADARATDDRTPPTRATKYVAGRPRQARLPI